MQSNNRFLDDMARMTSGALGTLAEARREIEAMAKHQVERLLDSMDLVTRDEFDTVRAMAEKARLEQERLEARIVELEARLKAKAKPSGGKGGAKKAEKSPAAKET